LAGLITWGTRIPSYVTGWSVVAKWKGRTTLFVLAPAESSEKLAVGQTVWVRRPGSRVLGRTRISHLEPVVQSPAAVRHRFGLSAETIEGPVVVASASADPFRRTARSPLPDSYLGTTAPADIEVGSRRALSLVPGFREVIH
ncbi:MAG TPA: hypothetical protein VIY86_09440, partial [Pirellulaceae bacterium]